MISEVLTPKTCSWQVGRQSSAPPQAASRCECEREREREGGRERERESERGSEGGREGETRNLFKDHHTQLVDYGVQRGLGEAALRGRCGSLNHSIACFLYFLCTHTILYTYTYFIHSIYIYIYILYLFIDILVMSWMFLLFGGLVFPVFGHSDRLLGFAVRLYDA